jgi:aspartyl-tRNA(Asn)/glutamyl-tRNA(Gln) amidotransferase subunit A
VPFCRRAPCAAAIEGDDLGHKTLQVPIPAHEALAGRAARADPGAPADSGGGLADPASEPAVSPGAPAFTLGVLSAQLTDPSVTAEVLEAVTDALAVLSAAGWRLREIAEPWLGQLARWENTLAVIVAAEAFKVHQGRDQDSYAAGTRALLAFGASVSAPQYANALRQRAELTAAIEASLTGVDVLAGPTVGYQEPEQDPPFGVGEDSAESRFTGPYNLTGHPAISLPVPSAGLPVGL